MEKIEGLTKIEAQLLLAVITNNKEILPLLRKGKRLDKAKESLIKKGFLRINDFRIIELNLADDYFQQRGYENSLG